jgi:hypothetical protein
VTRISGYGHGTIDIDVVNSNLVPEDHLFKITFTAPTDSVAATSYSLIDSTTSTTVIQRGLDLLGLGIGPVGAGLLPIVSTNRRVSVNQDATGFAPGSPTNVDLNVIAQTPSLTNVLRPGYPDDMTITFFDEVVDTSFAVPLFPALPAKFRIVAHSAGGDLPMRFRFRDLDADGTLSRTDEFIDVFTFLPGTPGTARNTWRFQIAQPAPNPIEPPGAGDVFHLRLIRPFMAGDEFVFTSTAARIDAAKAVEDFRTEPYVVPNPYVGSASFEPERFAVSGRGERRMEFRGLPQRAVIRIYTVRGDLVRTLEHDGSNDGFVPWDLRTKDNLDVAPGLYIFHVDGADLGTHVGKFAVIK